MRGISMKPFPRAWPDKASGDALDYSVDYSGWLSDCGDSISKIAVDDLSAAPAIGLQIGWAVFQNGIVSLGLSGGQTGLRYRLRIIVTTSQGRSVTGIFTLPVSTIESPAETVAFPSPGLTFSAGTIIINGTANT